MNSSLRGGVVWSGSSSGIEWEVVDLLQDGERRRFLVNGGRRLQSGMVLGNPPKPAFRYAKSMVEEAVAGHSRVLVLGAGGFCIPTCILTGTGNTEVSVVDTEGWLEGVSARYFQKPDSRYLRFIEAEAQSFLSSHRELYDLILVDLFGSDGLVPDKIVNRETISQMRAILRPGGSLLWNMSFGRSREWRRVAGRISCMLAEAGLPSTPCSHPDQDVYSKCNVVFFHSPQRDPLSDGWRRFDVEDCGETNGQVVWPERNLDNRRFFGGVDGL